MDRWDHKFGAYKSFFIKKVDGISIMYLAIPRLYHCTVTVCNGVGVLTLYHFLSFEQWELFHYIPTSWYLKIL